MDRRGARRIVLAVLLAVILGGGVIGAIVRHGSDRRDQAQLNRGAAIFRSSCARCHVIHAATGSAPTPPLDTQRPDEETVRRYVENGGNGMPAFRGLTKRQVDDVAAYVATASQAPIP